VDERVNIVLTRHVTDLWTVEKYCRYDYLWIWKIPSVLLGNFWFLV